MNQSVCGDWEQKEGSSSPREMAAAQVGARMAGQRQMSPDRQTSFGGTGSGPTDGGVVISGAETPQNMAKMKPQPPEEQMERFSGSETTTGGR